MIKAGIIGCGKIADQHAESIFYTKDAQLAGVCDHEILMAEQLKERYSVQHSFTDVDEFLRSADLDVVHITTPPQSHYDLGLKCLEAGCSVYIEKPFTLNTEEAIKLLDKAGKKGLVVTVGHNGQFSHAATRMRDLVRNGYLGGLPLHMESTFGYNLGDPSYAKALLGNKDHWVRKLPGNLLHNIISHGVCRIAEFMDTDTPDISSLGFASPLLRSIGEVDVVDELRVIIKGKEVTAYFTFSSQIKPILHQFRLYGSRNGLQIDEDDQTVIKLKDNNYKSFMNHIMIPLDFSKQYLGNLSVNAVKFLRRDFHLSRGMRLLVSSFYGAVRGENPVPIPYREIILTSYIMEKIFSDIYGKE